MPPSRGGGVPYWPSVGSHYSSGGHPHTMEGIVVEAELITDIMAVDHIMEAIVVGIITRGGVTHIRGGAYPQL